MYTIKDKKHKHVAGNFLLADSNAIAELHKFLNRLERQKITYEIEADIEFFIPHSYLRAKVWIDTN